MSITSKRNLQLDVLRGVAILLVIGRHLQMPRPEGIVGAFAEAWFRIGWLGVDLFFVLSGFLIGGLLLVELDKHGTIDVPRFLIRRGLKVYPPYFVFLTYVILMPVVKALIRGGDAGVTLESRWEALWPSLLFLQNYIGDNPEGHIWSLAVEEHFYLVLPFVVVALTAAGRVRWLVPLCLAMLPVHLMLRGVSIWTNDPFAIKMSATHLRLDALLFGVAIRGIAQYVPERFMGWRRWRGALAAAGILLWLPNLFVEPSTALIRTLGLTGTLLGAGCLLIAAYHTHAGDFGPLGRFVLPVASLVAWIGIYSYGIYLWHVTAIGILEREFGGRVIALAGGINQSVWLVSAPVITGAAIGIGIAASKLVEWPILRLRDRFFPSRTGSLPPIADRVRTEVKLLPRLPVS